LPVLLSQQRRRYGSGRTGADDDNFHLLQRFSLKTATLIR
jgi:hypothetical protein